MAIVASAPPGSKNPGTPASSEDADADAARPSTADSSAAICDCGDSIIECRRAEVVECVRGATCHNQTMLPGRTHACGNVVAMTAPAHGGDRAGCGGRRSNASPATTTNHHQKTTTKGKRQFPRTWSTISLAYLHTDTHEQRMA